MDLLHPPIHVLSYATLEEVPDHLKPYARDENDRGSSAAWWDDYYEREGRVRPFHDLPWQVRLVPAVALDMQRWLTGVSQQEKAA